MSAAMPREQVEALPKLRYVGPQPDYCGLGNPGRWELPAGLSRVTDTCGSWAVWQAPEAMTFPLGFDWQAAVRSGCRLVGTWHFQHGWQQPS